MEPDRERGAPSSLITTQGTSLGLTHGSVWLDITAFDDARLGRAAELNNDPTGALDALTEALTLWRGDIAADIDAEWLTQVREHRNSQFIAMAARAGRLRAAGPSLPATEKAPSPPSNPSSKPATTSASKANPRETTQKDHPNAVLVVWVAPMGGLAFAADRARPYGPGLGTNASQ